MSRLSPILAAGEVVGVDDSNAAGLGVLAGSTVPFDSSRPGTAATVSTMTARATATVTVTDVNEAPVIEDAAREFVWLEEWPQASGFEYHASGTPYNEHFHSIIDDYTDERCGV